MLEIIGWVGSALVIVSLTQARVLRFRVVDANGAVVARSDNSLAEQTSPGLLTGIAQPMRGGFVGTPFFAKRVRFSGPADRLQHYEVRMPAQAVIKDIVAPAGSGAPEGRLDASVATESPLHHDVDLPVDVG